MNVIRSIYGQKVSRGKGASTFDTSPFYSGYARKIRTELLSLPINVAIASILAVATATSASASINCADTLPSSYFKRIDDKQKFAGKLVTLANGTQQLQNPAGRVILDNLSNAYVLMNKYVWAERQGKQGIVTATGHVIVPFRYDSIAFEPDIYTSFIVSNHTPNGVTKQGIINRHGYWIYPLPIKTATQSASMQKSQSIAQITPTPWLRAARAPRALLPASISHAHYDSPKDRDYFVIASAGMTKKTIKVGLLDDKGTWVIPQVYDALQPLNPCTDKPLYLQARLQQKTALINQQHKTIIPLASNQHIEAFNDNVTPLLFLRSTLVAGSSATGFSEDIKDEIVSAQIIDATGKLRLSSSAPITKLLYHQLYMYRQSGKYGVINNQAKVILAPQFTRYRDEGDKVWVEKNGKMVRLEPLIK
ncbi:WG repeat-containing protein [Psychrobacter sp. 16-MNA-CIBAN-0192]|uniref:WG repeat-containing protein n=1 Tax=Psychrobacter sp. 16-MNA-CIBAN-0192 TaxID=3140448 RepID=UPI0033229906